MRERLEHIKETGGADLNEEDVQLLQQLEDVALDSEESQQVRGREYSGFHDVEVDLAWCSL